MSFKVSWIILGFDPNQNECGTVIYISSFQNRVLKIVQAALPLFLQQVTSDSIKPCQLVQGTTCNNLTDAHSHVPGKNVSTFYPAYFSGT